MFAQDFFAEMLVALEVDAAHRTFDAFVDRINDTRRPFALVDRFDSKIDRDIGEPFDLINVDDFLSRFMELVLVNR